MRQKQVQLSYTNFDEQVRGLEGDIINISGYLRFKAKTEASVRFHGVNNTELSVTNGENSITPAPRLGKCISLPPTLEGWRAT